MLSVIGFNELRSMDLVSWLPGVVCFWIPYPLDEILESSSPPDVPVIDHFLHFVLLFSFDKVRR